MSIFDPVYGELLTAKEVCSATGLTMNQLRNWRMPSRIEGAPFGYVQIGVAPHYRKNVIEKWLETNVDKNVRFVPAGLDNEIPINAAISSDLGKQKALHALADINTSTMWLRYFTPVSETLRADFGKKYRLNAKALYAHYKGVSAESVEPLTYGTRHENLELFYVSSVLAIRALWAEINGWDITPDELISLPIGDVPPLKEIK